MVTPLRAYYLLLVLLGVVLSLSWIPLLVLVQLADLRVGWAGALAWSLTWTCAAARTYLWTRERIQAWSDGERAEHRS